MHEQTIDAGVEQDKEKMSVQRDVTYPLVIQLEHQKELAENEEGAVWSERRVKLANCMEQKRRA